MLGMDSYFGTGRTADQVANGVTKDVLRGRAWQQRGHGLWRPAGEDPGEADGRVADAIALMSGGCALGGWASLRFQGNDWFDGLGPEEELRPALVHCPPKAQLRRRDMVEPCRAAVWDHEISEMAGVRVTSMARAVYDEMRLAPTMRHAVIALDKAVSRVSQKPRTSIRAVEQVADSHRKTRGIVQARRALALGSERSLSPWETRTRLLAQIDAGLTNLLVNVPIFDRFENLLGVADLLDEPAGLVIESDGSHHRQAQHHADDNEREEKFERVGLVVVRATALDHRDVPRLVRRIVMARRDALASSRRDWTLQKPSWWPSWAPGRRWE